MPITNLKIHGYRGFQTQGSINFATPNGQFGSGLTTITGSNNSGKSSILECLRARAGNADISFTAGTRNTKINKVEIIYVVDNVEQKIESVSKGSSEVKSTKIDEPRIGVMVLPSRRAFSAYFGKNSYSRETYISVSKLPPQRSSQLDHFSSRLFTTLGNADEFNKILNKVLMHEPQWTIDQSDQGQYFLKFFNGEHSHSSDGMGEGIVSIFAIVDSLYDSKPGDVVVIDEPELSLHPSLQKRVSDLLCEYAIDRQIIISTHSPYFVSPRSLANGGALARVVSENDGTKIYQLSEKSKGSISRLAETNLFNPHIFGLDARELFFQEDRIVITEGQEDVLLLPQIAEQLGIQVNWAFFGWGAGGAGNIGHLCAIFKDLGFKKVVGLLDGDKANDRDKLSKEFPEFHFLCIPAKDIRTKPARKAEEEVIGLLDTDRKLRAEHKLKMTELFADLKKSLEN